jgi:hypothetical protein
MERKQKTLESVRARMTASALVKDAPLRPSNVAPVDPMPEVIGLKEKRDIHVSAKTIGGLTFIQIQQFKGEQTVKGPLTISDAVPLAHRPLATYTAPACVIIDNIIQPGFAQINGQTGAITIMPATGLFQPGQNGLCALTIIY